MVDVRDYIEPAIQKSGMKKKVVARKAGITDQQLSDIMAKRRRLDANEFVNICFAIHMNPNDVLVLGIEPDSAEKTEDFADVPEDADTSVLQEV